MNLRNIRVLVTGGNGMLGSDLKQEFKDLDMHAFNKEELDITKKSHVIRSFKEIKPHLVMNCAAYTDVDGSESNKKGALRVNSLGARNIAMMCKKLDSALVHYSTDYVFDGRNENGYKENAMKNPINYYGYTKSLGEDYITKITRKHWIIRSSWLFGKSGNNFVGAILNKRNDAEIKVVNDQKGCPTYTRDLAKATKELVGDYDFGIYHMTNSGSCTWFDFAEEIVRQSGSRAKVIPISSKEISRPAIRPRCSVLVNTKFKNKLPFWDDGLRRYLKELK